MKYFIVLLPMLDDEKSQKYRPQHLDFLARLRNEGKILASGVKNLYMRYSQLRQTYIELPYTEPYVRWGERSKVILNYKDKKS